MSVLLRLFVQCPNEDAAAAMVIDLAESLRALRALPTMPPERYWKMPELFELAFRLFPGTRDTFDAVVSRAPHGWTHLGDADDRSSVWNRTPGATLLLPEVAWAEAIYSSADDLH